MEETGKIKTRHTALWISAAVVLLLLVAGGYYIGRWYFYFKAHPQEAATLLGYVKKVDTSELQKLLLNPQSPQWGAEKPIVTIVEFGDFRCPQCYKEFFVLRPLLMKYKDVIRFYWRDYPGTAVESGDFAIAARCANEQKKFIEFHDRLFQKQGELAESDLIGVAQQVGLNSFLFSTCLDKKVGLELIKKDIADAEFLGIKGTPTIFINGKSISGAAPTEVLEKIILDILNNYEGNSTTGK